MRLSLGSAPSISMGAAFPFSDLWTTPHIYNNHSEAVSKMQGHGSAEASDYLQMSIRISTRRVDSSSFSDNMSNWKTCQAFPVGADESVKSGMLVSVKDKGPISFIEPKAPK